MTNMEYSDKHKRIVVKIGTSTLTYATGKLNIRRIETLVRVLSDMRNAGLDMKKLRKSLVEETMANALPRIIAEGDIERLAQLAEMAGEAPKSEIPDGAKRIMRERVIIELDD